MNNFYVYEWIRLDTMEPFYVGKGKGDRCYYLKRNYYFNNIVNKVDSMVHILKNNLTEEEAFQYECWYIYEYKYEIGYDLTNVTDGGEGGNTWINNPNKDEIKLKISSKVCGEKNGFYGKKHSKETIARIRNSETGRKMKDEVGKKISKANKIHFSDIQINDIINRQKNGETFKNIAKSYNVCPNKIRNICIENGYIPLQNKKNNINQLKKRSKLSDEEVIDILILLKKGEQTNIIAKTYNVSNSTIVRINNGFSYSWVSRDIIK